MCLKWKTWDPSGTSWKGGCSPSLRGINIAPQWGQMCCQVPEVWSKESTRHFSWRNTRQHGISREGVSVGVLQTEHLVCRNARWRLARRSRRLLRIGMKLQPVLNYGNLVNKTLQRELNVCRYISEGSQETERRFQACGYNSSVTLVGCSTKCLATASFHFAIWTILFSLITWTVLLIILLTSIVCFTLRRETYCVCIAKRWHITIRRIDFPSGRNAFGRNDCNGYHTALEACAAEKL